MKKIFFALSFILLNINILIAQIPSECLGGTLIFSENFSTNESQWTKAWGWQGASATNAFFGINNGQFVVRSARGQTPCGTQGGGINDNYLTSIPVNIAAYQGGTVHFAYDISVKGKMEGLDENGNFYCMGTDEVVGEYSVNGGSSWNVVNQFYGDGCNGCSTDDNWTAEYHISECVNLPQSVSNFIIRFKMGNQSASEYYYLDNVTLTALMPITGTNTVARGSTIQLNNATPNGTWSSSNTAIATVSQSGVVTGIVQGAATITYSIGCCEVQFMVTVTEEVPDPDLPDNIVEAECVGTPPVQEWRIREVATNSATHYSTFYPVLVGDLDGDGIPELVAVNRISETNSNTNRAYILDNMANIKKQFAIQPTYSGANSLSALGKVKISDSPETYQSLIFFLSSETHLLYAYDAQGNLKWTSNAVYDANGIAASILLVDLEGDGWAELVVGNKVFAAESGKLLLNMPGSSSINHTGGANWCMIHSSVGDVLSNGHQQVCSGNAVYDATITNRGGTSGNTYTTKTITPVMFDNSSITGTPGHTNGATQVVDFDLDGNLDVVVSTVNQTTLKCYVYVWSPVNEEILASAIINNVYKKSVPFVGDIDGDGYPEIVFVHGRLSGDNIDITIDKITALKYNPESLNRQLSIFWQIGHYDTSGSTAITLFDFNQDGISELVYRDEQHLRIINGSKKSHITGNDTTAVYDLATIPCKSATTLEYPVIADIDGDGQAEILVIGPASGINMPRLGPIRIFKAGEGTVWASARTVWNQYSYNVVHINEDLTIPKFPMNPATLFPNGKRPYNNFLQQQTFLNTNGDPLWLLSNIEWTGELEANSTCGSIVFKGCITNTGNVALQSPIYVTFYKNDTIAANIIATNSIQKSLKVDSTLCFELTVNNVNGYAPFSGIWVSVNDRNGNYPYQEQCMLDGRRKIPIYYDLPVLDTICQGDSILFGSQYYKQPGTHCNTLTTVAGYDSIITLNLTTLPYKTKTLNDMFCEGKSYDFNGRIITTAGIYKDTVSAVLGCDTVVTLNLTTLPYQTKTLNDMFCEGKSYDFNGRIITTAGIYKDTVSAISGCDTVITLNLTVQECYKVQIEPPGEICADDKFFLLKYNILEGNITCYSVNFNQKALSQGFVDIPCTNPNSSEEIRIPIPQFSYNQYVRPDYNYSFVVTFTLGDSTETHNINFDVLYPSWIMQQKWNDVIALLNYNFNGGYEWSDYEWYINGAKIPTDRNSYIYTPDYNKATLEFGQEYRALLTRVDDGVQIFTCPLIPESQDDILLFPTIVSPQQTIQIQVKTKIKVIMWSVTGIKISEQDFNIGENTITAPYAEGVYILQFISENKNGEIRKIIVKK